MYNVDEETKNAYRRDSVDKTIFIQVVGAPTIFSSNIVSESITIEQMLCSTDYLHFGECNVSKITFNIAEYDTDLIGKQIWAYLMVSGTELMNLGIYTVTEVKNIEGRPFKSVTALSLMNKLNVDITDFYDSINFPITLKDLRDSIFNHVGLEQETVTLPFDDVIISKNWIGNNVNAKTVIEGICELNGRFGIIDEDNCFDYREIRNSEILNANGLLKKHVIDSDFETKEFDGVIVTDDYGTMFRSGIDLQNPYVITNNVCLYGMDQAELRAIVTRLLPMYTGHTYTPIYSCTMKGQPYAEIGDKIRFGNKTSYILKRTLKGVQSLTDTIVADGVEYTKYDKNSVANQLGNLNRSTGRLKIDMAATQEGVQIAVSKSEQALEKAENIQVGGVNLVDNSWLFGCVDVEDVELIYDEDSIPDVNLRDDVGELITE